MAKIAVSYRRKDAWAKRALVDQLKAKFGDVFVDTDSLQPGEQYPQQIKEAFGSAAVVLAIIGEDWRKPKPDGTFSIMDPEDPVRIELEPALAQGRPIIPILIEEGALPAKSDLPESLKSLPDYQAVPFRPGIDTANDIARIVAAISRLLEKAEADRTALDAAERALARDADRKGDARGWRFFRGSRRPRQQATKSAAIVATVSAVAVVAIGSIIYFVLQPSPPAPLPPATTQIVFFPRSNTDAALTALSTLLPQNRFPTRYDMSDQRSAGLLDQIIYASDVDPRALQAFLGIVADEVASEEEAAAKARANVAKMESAATTISIRSVRIDPGLPSHTIEVRSAAGTPGDLSCVAGMSTATLHRLAVAADFANALANVQPPRVPVCPTFNVLIHYRVKISYAADFLTKARLVIAGARGLQLVNVDPNETLQIADMGRVGEGPHVDWYRVAGDEVGSAAAQAAAKTLAALLNATGLPSQFLPFTVKEQTGSTSNAAKTLGIWF